MTQPDQKSAFRTRDEQVMNAFPFEGTGLVLMYQKTFKDHLIEAEARGAAEEQRRKDTEGSEIIYQVQHEDGVWHEYALTNWQAVDYPTDRKRILYTHPANVAALEARIAELEGVLDALVKISTNVKETRAQRGIHWADLTIILAHARAALKREGGE